MIHFYDKDRQLIMSFSDFSLIDREYDKISFSINLSFGFFKTFLKTEIFLSYLQRFADELKSLHDNIQGKKQAEFLPVERDIEILFELINFGHISVRIRLHYYNFSHNENGVLECNYKIDQSFLPELIEEISSAISNDLAS